MAWIESHQSLRDHPKTRKLCRLLEISVATAVGHLQCLWWWSIDYAEDGDLSRHDALDIAIGGEWEGAPDTFVDALVTVGFLDRSDSGLTIHDWHEYAGKLIERRKANAERMRVARATRESTTSAERAPHVQRTQRARAGLPTEPTQHNQQDRTNPTTTSAPAAPGDAGASPTAGSTTGPSGTAAKSSVLSPKQQAHFDRWYAEWPRKVGRGAAERAWSRIRPAPDAALVERMIATVQAWRESEQWTKDAGQFIPYPSTWLANGRWTDDPPPRSRGPSPGPRASVADRNANAFAEIYASIDAMDHPPDGDPIDVTPDSHQNAGRAPATQPGAGGHVRRLPVARGDAQDRGALSRGSPGPAARPRARDPGRHAEGLAARAVDLADLGRGRGH